MNAQYQGKYFDEFGEEAITIENDGKLLRTVIRNTGISEQTGHCTE